MVYLGPCNSPVPLEELAARIRKSSNFRFNWQFFEFDGFNARSPIGVRQALGLIIFQLLPGNAPGCSGCRQYNNHLFTNWFYGVAWDWRLFASWPKRKLFWMGCLTDTD